MGVSAGEFLIWTGAALICYKLGRQRISIRVGGIATGEKIARPTFCVVQRPGDIPRAAVRIENISDSEITLDYVELYWIDKLTRGEHTLELTPESGEHRLLPPRQDRDKDSPNPEWVTHYLIRYSNADIEPALNTEIEMDAIQSILRADMENIQLDVRSKSARRMLFIGYGISLEGLFPCLREQLERGPYPKHQVQDS